MTIQNLKKICGEHQGQVIIKINDKELIIQNIKIQQNYFNETNNQTEPKESELIINLFALDDEMARKTTIL
jgi:hypothetical protein